MSFFDIINGFCNNLPAIVIVLPLLFSIFLFLLSSEANNTFVVNKIIKTKYCFVLVFSFISTLALMYLTQDENIIYNIGNYKQSMGISLIVSPKSAFLMLIICVGFAISFIGSLFNKVVNSNIYAFYCLILTGLIGLCFTVDFFNMYIFIELISIASYIVISYNPYNSNSYKGAFNYLIVGSIAGLIILLGIMFIYSASGELNMITVSSCLNCNKKLMSFGYVFIVIGLLLKAGYFPLHSWLMGSYKSGLSYTVAILAGTIAKVTIFNIYKITVFLNSFILTINEISNYFILLSFVGIITISFYIIKSNSLFEQILYSSMVQTCYFAIGVFVKNDIILNATMVQMLSHTLSVSSMLILLGFFNESSGKMQNTTLETNNVSFKILFSMLILGVAGYPFTIGFTAKWFILSVAGVLEKYIFFASMIISSTLGMAYSWKMIEGITMHNTKEENPKINKRLHYSAIIPMVLVLVLTCVGFAISSFIA